MKSPHALYLGLQQIELLPFTFLQHNMYQLMMLIRNCGAVATTARHGVLAEYTPGISVDSTILKLHKLGVLQTPAAQHV